MSRRLRRDLHKRIPSAGYHKFSGDIEVTGTIISPTVERVVTAIDKIVGGTTTPVKLDIHRCEGLYRAIVIQWLVQYNLMNFDHYEVQVSNDDATWYSLKSDGTDWKDTLNADTDVGVPFFIHTDIPLTGTEAEPTVLTLYYRMRQVTILGIEGPWSDTASATISGINVGDIIADAITNAKIATDAVDTVQIKNDAVETAKILNDAITSDKIVAGAVITAKLYALAVTSEKIAALAITVGKIAANAVQTQNLSVIARELINNISQTHVLNGWGGIKEDGTGSTSVMSLVDATVNGATTKVLRFTNSGNMIVRTKTFSINHNKIYRFTLWLKKSSTDGGIYLGLSAFDEINEGMEGTGGGLGDKLIQSYNSSTRAYIDETIDERFHAGFDQTSWTEYTSYIVGANRDVDDCPQHKNCSFILKLKSDTTYAAIRVIDWGNTSEQTLDISSPSITEVGAGQIVAENIVAGAIIASKIDALAVTTAKLAAGAVTADKILAGTITATELAAAIITAREMAFSGDVYNSDDPAPDDAILIDLAQPDCMASDGTPPNSDKEIVYIAPEWKDENGVKTRNPATKLFDGGGGDASKQGAIGLFQAAANLVKDPEDFTTTNWTKHLCDTALSDLYCDGKRFTKITLSDDLGRVEQSISFTGDAVKSTSIIIKNGSGANVQILIRDADDGLAVKLNMTINWIGNTITESTGTAHIVNWLDNDTVSIGMITGALTAANDNQLWYRAPLNGDYFYITAVQAIDNPYPLPYTPTTRAAGILNLPIALVNKFTLIFWVRPWFTYDVANNCYLAYWYVDATHYLACYYYITDDKIIVTWKDGGTQRALFSQQLDDSGTNDVNQWIMVAMSIDLSAQGQTASRLKVYTEAGSIGEDTDWGGAPDAFTGAFPLMSIGQREGSNLRADSLLTDLLYLPGTLFTEAQMDAHYAANRPWYSPTEVANESKSVRIDKSGIRMHNSSLTITDNRNRLIDISNRTGLLAKDAGGTIIHDIPDAPVLSGNILLGHSLHLTELADYRLLNTTTPVLETWTPLQCLTNNNNNIKGVILIIGCSRYFNRAGVSGWDMLDVYCYVRPKGSNWSAGIPYTTPSNAPCVWHRSSLDTASVGDEKIVGYCGGNGMVFCPLGDDNSIDYYFGDFPGTLYNGSRRLSISQLGILI